MKGYLKPVIREVYINVIKTTPLRQGSYSDVEHLPKEDGYFAIVDDSGLGLLGVFSVNQGTRYSATLSGGVKIQKESNSGVLSDEHHALNTLLSNCPFRCYIQNTDLKLKSIRFDEFAFNRNPLGWITTKENEIKAALVEKDYTQNQIFSLITQIEKVPFANTVFTFEPGLGLIYPLDSIYLKKGM